MTRVLVVLPRTHVSKAVEALYGLRLLHLHDHVEGRDGLELGRTLEGAAEASETLIRLRAMLATLGIADHRVDRPLPVDAVMRELEAKFDHLEHEIETTGENRNRLRSEVRNIEQRLAALEPFIGLGLDLDLYHGYEHVDVIVGMVGGDPGKALERADIAHELFRPKDPQKTGLMALFVERGKADQARAILGELGFSPIPVFEGSGDPRALRVELKEGLAKVNSSLEEVELELRTITRVHGDMLVAAEEHLSIMVEKAESPLRCAGTANTLLVEGWVPTSEIPCLHKALQAAVGDAYHVEELGEDELSGNEHGRAVEVAPDGGEPDGSEEVPTKGHEDRARETPVLFRNPEGVKVHEYLVGLVSTPRYDEVDPSLFMYFTFPVLFGIMVGDIGYGLLFIIFGFLLIRLQSEQGFMGRHWHGVGIVTGITRVRMTRMIMISGFVTALFGLLFGELFGLELFGRHGIVWAHYLYVPALDVYLPINRLEDAMLMIVLCIYVGIFHVLLGLTIGFVNARKHHGTLHAVLAKGSWFLIVIGGFLVFKLFFSADEVAISDTPMLVGMVLLFGGIIMLLAGEGMGGVLELPSIVSNIMSYTRLFAIGLSSLGIAMTFNNLGEMLAEGGGAGGIIGGWAVAISGHTINMFLALLAPSLHALRLHYVEWMTKFYAGGGTPYEPFGRERVYTEV